MAVGYLCYTARHIQHSTRKSIRAMSFKQTERGGGGIIFELSAITSYISHTDWFLHYQQYHCLFSFLHVRDCFLGALHQEIPLAKWLASKPQICTQLIRDIFLPIVYYTQSQVYVSCVPNSMHACMRHSDEKRMEVAVASNDDNGCFTLLRRPVM